MRFSRPNITIQNEIFLFLNEGCVFQIIYVKSGRHPDLIETISVKGLYGVEAGLFKQTPFSCRLPVGDFLLQDLKQICLRTFGFHVVTDLSNVTAQPQSFTALGDLLLQGLYPLSGRVGHTGPPVGGQRASAECLGAGLRGPVQPLCCLYG